jgi:hypothetical protein
MNEIIILSHTSLPIHNSFDDLNFTHLSDTRNHAHSQRGVPAYRFLDLFRFCHVLHRGSSGAGQALRPGDVIKTPHDYLHRSIRD